MPALRQTVVIPLILLCGCTNALAQKPKFQQDAVSHEESRKTLRALTFDDLLAIEDTGKAASSHDGSLIVYEKAPPYVERLDFGGDVSSAIYAFDPGSVDRSRPLFAAEKGTGYWLASRNPFSPSDDYLAFYSVKNGLVSIGAFDVRRRRLLYGAGTPAVGDVIKPNAPVWIDRETLVYAALPKGSRPSQVGYRRHTGEQFYEAWKASWAGERPSFRAVTNTAAQGEPPNSTVDGQLIAFNATKGETRVLASGKYTDLQLSADGRYLAVLKIGPKPLSQPTEDWVWSRTELVIFDLSAGRTLKPAPGLDVFPRSLAWSEGGSRLAFFSWPTGKSVRAFGGIRVFDANDLSLRQWPHRGLELASRREITPVVEQPERFYWVGSALAVLARPLPDRTAPGQFSYRGWVENDAPAALTPPDWMLLHPDGKQLVLSDGLKDVSRLPLAVTGDAIFVLADGDVWRLSSTGVKKNLSANYPVPLVQAAEFVNEPISTPSASATAAYRPPSAILEEQTTAAKQRYVFVTLDKQVLFTPVATNAERHGMQRILAASNQALLIRLYHHGGGSILLSLSARSGNVQRDAINQHMKFTGPQEWTLLKYRSSISGDILQSCMLLPIDYEPGQRYPAIIKVYPSFNDSRCTGPQRSPIFFIDQRNTLLTPAFKDQMLAANGYIVVWAVSPASQQRTAAGPLAGLPTLMVDAANALGEQGLADPDRIGLFGFSQGGAAALWTAAKTNRFNAVVAVNGFSNYWSHYFQVNARRAFFYDEFPFGVNSGRYETGHGPFSLGVSPWEDPGAYIRNSPIFHAKDIAAPILLTNSDMDTFPATQYEEMYNALLHYNKPVKLITYWGEGHHLASPANIRHLWEGVLGWYQKYLGPKPAQSPAH